MTNRRDRYTGLSSDTERQINQATGELDGRLKTLEQPAGRAGIVKTNTVAKVGEFLTVEAPPTGLQILLPPPTAAIRNARITISFVNINPVVISCAGGTVNSGTNVTNNAKGVIECICDGISNWTVPQTVTTGGSVINAEYFVGAAHSGLTNERVAQDTTEIDVVLTTPGLVSWVIKNGSIVLTKLEPIADDTFLGNISGGAASPAAISFTSFAGDGISYDATNHQWDVNGSTSIVVTSDEVRRAALSGAIIATENSNATLFGGILDNGSAENNRTNLNFLSTTSVVAVITDDSGSDELELTWQRAALTGDITASQNSNSTSFRVFDAKSVLVNATNSSAVPDDLAASTFRHVLRANDANTALEWGWPVAVFQGGEIDRGDFYTLNFSGGTNTEVLTVDEGSGVCTITYSVDDFPLSGLGDINARTVVANATNASAAPTAVQASTARHVLRDNSTNTGLEWGYPVSGRANSGTAFDLVQFDFIDSTYIDASIGGTATNAFVQFSLDLATLLAAIDSTSIVVSSSTLQRAALTGAVSASQNSNATLFAGVQVDSVAQTARTNFNILSTTTITWTGSDSSVNDRINLFCDRAALTGAIAAPAGSNATKFAGILDNGSATTDRTNLNFIGFTVADDAGNDRINITSINQPDVVQSFTTSGTSNDVTLNAGTTILRVDTGNNAWRITGFARSGGNFDGDKIIIENASNSTSVGGLMHATGSSSANQILTPGSIERHGARYSAVLVYDGTDSQWRVVSDTSVSYLPLTESAESSVPTPAASKAIVWVEDNAPNSLMFSDDAGNIRQVVAVGQPAIGLTIANDGVNWQAYQDSHITTATTVVTNSTAETTVLSVNASSLTAGATYEMVANCTVTRGATLTASNLRVRLKTGGATTGTFNGDVGVTCQATTGTNKFTVRAMWKVESVGATATVTTHGEWTSELPARDSAATTYLARNSGTFNTTGSLSMGFSVLFGTAVSNLAVVIESGYIRRTG